VLRTLNRIPTPETQKQKRAVRKLEKAFHTDEEQLVEIMPASTAAAIEANKPKLVTILLKRHYRPMGEYESGGHWTEEQKRKNPAGVVEVVKPSEFVAEEAKPSPMAGVVPHSLKLWAGTVVRLPIDEARFVRQQGIGEVEIE
jgi:hypothetical protein